MKQNKISFDHGTIVNIYIVYEINKNFNISSYPTIENCFSSAVKFTKHPDIYHYKYSRYGIGFDRKGFFSLGNEIGRNISKFRKHFKIFSVNNMKCQSVFYIFYLLCIKMCFNE